VRPRPSVWSGSAPNWCLSRPARIKIWEHRGFGEDPVYPDALFPPGNPNLPGKRDAG